MAGPRTQEERDAWEMITKMIIDDVRGIHACEDEEDEDDEDEMSPKIEKDINFSGKKRPINNVREAKQQLEKLENVQQQLTLIEESHEICKYMLQQTLKRENVPVNIREMLKDINELMNTYRYFLNEKIDNAII